MSVFSDDFKLSFEALPLQFGIVRNPELEKNIRGEYGGKIQMTIKKRSDAGKSPVVGMLVGVGNLLQRLDESAPEGQGVMLPNTTSIGLDVGGKPVVVAWDDVSEFTYTKVPE